LSDQPNAPEHTADNGANVNPTEGVEAGVWSTATQRASEVASKAADTTRNAASKTADTTRNAANKTADTASKAADTTRNAASKAADTTRNAASKAADTANKAADTTRNAASKAADATAAGASRVVESAQTLLSSDLSDTVNGLVAAAVKGPATIYDKAMDANYLDPLLRPGLGGSYHRLFDGGHTIAGAAKAVHQATPDDTIIQEAHGMVLGLLKDASTPRGLPLTTWDKSTFDSVAATLNDKFSIPKSWLYEVNTFDIADLLGATVSVVAVVFGWNRADTETFAQLAASAGISAAVAANPLLTLVSLVALARSYDKARRSGEYGELADGAARGAIGSTATLATVAAVSVAGGSAGLMLLSGLTAGVLVHRVTRDLVVADVPRHVKDVTRFVARSAATIAAEARLKAAGPIGEAADDDRRVPERINFMGTGSS